MNGMVGIDKEINCIEYLYWGDDVKIGYDNYDIFKEIFKLFYIRLNGDINIEFKKMIYFYGV